MKHHRVAIVALWFLIAASAPTQSPIKLHDGGIWSNFTTIPSVVWTNPASNQEAADDFNVMGTVTRVVANGNGCSSCVPAALAGVHVRFYASQGGFPGGLQYQAFVPAGSPQLLYNPADIAVLDITLPNPFTATGQHFVSVQADFVVAGYWGFWVADYNAPTAAPFRYRDNLTTGTWGGYSTPFGPVNSDLDLDLWGFPATPQPQPTDPCGAWSVLSPPPVPASTHNLVRDLKVIAADDVWAVGDATTGQPGSIATLNVAWHWDGIQWTQVPIPSPTSGGTPNCTLLAVDGSGPNDVYAAGWQSIVVPGSGWYGPQLEVAHWDGSQWTVLPNTPLPPNTGGAGVSGATVHDIDVLGPTEIWFAGFWINLMPSGFTTQPGLLMRYDGSSFTMTNVPLVVSGGQGQSFSRIEAIAPDDVWAIGHRYGLSTPLVPTGAPLVFHWNGTQWSSLSPPIPGTQTIFSDIAALGTNDVYILGHHTPSPGGPTTRFMVHWNGSSWTTLPGPAGGAWLKAFSSSDIYAGGGGVWHFDGNGWTQVQAFASLSSASFAAIDGIAPCQLWGAGGQVVIGQSMPFAARQDASLYWDVTQHTGCAPGSTPGSLVALTPPKLGTLFTVGTSDPGQALTLSGPVGLSFWVGAAAPIGTGGCGVPLPGTGAGGGSGELFVDLATVLVVSGPVAWSGGAAVATHGVFLPYVPELAGIQAFTQAALADATNPANLILTTGLEVQLGY
jgi:hypothetical protein